MNNVLGDTSSAYSFELKLLLSHSDNRDSVIGRHHRPDGLPTTTRAVSNSRVCDWPPVSDPESGAQLTNFSLGGARVGVNDENEDPLDLT